MPAGYGRDLFILQPRDPRWIYAYWELAAARLTAGRRRLGSEAESAQLILRLYRATPSKAEPAFDLLLASGSSDRTFAVDLPGMTWVAQIGWRSPSGGFQAVIRSNSVRTPSEEPSPEVDEQWGYLPLPVGREGPSS